MGTCIIKPRSGHDPKDAGSATCEGLGFYYTCGGSYDSPNCVSDPVYGIFFIVSILIRCGALQNLCAQSYLNNARPGREIVDCPGVTWCSSDEGKSFHKCKLHEEPYHPEINIGVKVGATTVSSQTRKDIISSDISKLTGHSLT
jgi:hypothetical protein